MTSLTWRSCAWWAAALLATQAGALQLLGRPVICVCGYVKLWEANAFSAETSQHLLDWYSFTHLIHGFLFYFLITTLFPKVPPLTRLLIAVGVEAAWEVAENTSIVINLYRQQAVSLNYMGDSIVNSVSDTLMSIAGFVLAWRLPAWSIVLLAVAIEITLVLIIRDNFTLNIVNFIHPFDALTKWQNGAL